MMVDAQASERPLRIAVLVKQIPALGESSLDSNSRLVRDPVAAEMNPFCRRAVAKGVELARTSGGECIVVTMGPPASREVLREAIAWGADRGLLISDPALAGADTLITAIVLAAAVRHLGAVDLIMSGRTAVDSETGQLGAQVAELLGISHLGAARDLTINTPVVHADCEQDDSVVSVSTRMPAVIAVAERLSEPAKVAAAERGGVEDEAIKSVALCELGLGGLSGDASPTTVGARQSVDVARSPHLCQGDVDAAVAETIDLLQKRTHAACVGMEPVPVDRGIVGAAIVVVADQHLPSVAQEIVGEAATLAMSVGGHVVLASPAGADSAVVGSWGADVLLELHGPLGPVAVTTALTDWCAGRRVAAILGPSSVWGRELLGRYAARHRLGLVADAVSISSSKGPVLALKPCGSGRELAEIRSRTAPTLVTTRPGCLVLRSPRTGVAKVQNLQTLAADTDIHEVSRTKVDDWTALDRATTVIGVGDGVAPSDLPEIYTLARRLNAEVAATRRLVDKGLFPRSRQIGITGRNIAPKLYIAVGVSGRPNHLIGVGKAQTIIFINVDRNAPGFDTADVGIVGDWHLILPLLVARLSGDRAVEAMIRHP